MPLSVYEAQELGRASTHRRLEETDEAVRQPPHGLEMGDIQKRTSERTHIRTSTRTKTTAGKCFHLGSFFLIFLFQGLDLELVRTASGRRHAAADPTLTAWSSCCRGASTFATPVVQSSGRRGLLLIDGFP